MAAVDSPQVVRIQGPQSRRGIGPSPRVASDRHTATD